MKVPLERAALFLDLDGTIAPIAPTPDAVGPDAARTALLRRAAERLDGRVAVVSGRTIADVDRILERSIACVAGVHGLERRDADGCTRTAAPDPGVPDALAVCRAFAAAQPGLIVEAKGLSVTLHYRGAPDAAEAVRELGRRLAAAGGLTLQDGDMVIELRTPGPDKGDAVRAFLAEPPFRGAAPIFVGDDLTDEAGFRAAQAAGGIGLFAGPARPTSALGRLEGPSQVLAWLEAALSRGAFETGEGTWAA